MDELLIHLETWGSQSWWKKVLVWVPILLIMLLIFYKFWQDGEQLAQMEIDRERLKQQLEDKKIEAKLAEEENKIREAKEQEAALNVEIREIDKRIKERREAHAVREAEIDRATDWDSIEREWRARQ